MNEKKHSYSGIIALIVVFIVILIGKFTTTASSVQNTAWALVPPIIAIALALITKEAYSSLFIGIVTGGLLYSGYSFTGTIHHVFYEQVGDESYGIVGVLSSTYNIGILIFLVILGAVVALMNKAGGSAAFGEWAKKKIKTRVGAQCATIVLGIMIFIDDYFNCLTVGSVMRPVTDKFRISRAKLAYIIDSTAAPICIIAPISSWAAAVSGFVKGENGLTLFIKAIPFNYYALFTILMMFSLVFMKTEFGPMAVHEENAVTKGDLFTTPDRPYDETDEVVNSNGKVIDLVIPIVSLVICCVIGMIATGGFFQGKSFVDAFASSDASVGLSVGSFFALIIVFILYTARKVLTFKDCMDCLPEGFKAMVPAIMILIFAWSLKSMTDSLGAAPFVAGIVQHYAKHFMIFLPAIIFLIGCGLAFATGTSWGTFGILIPIVVNAFQQTDPQLMLIAISACMAGAVCGDHCSPISDTTIMSSAGARCNHVNHVTTQLPYAVFVAGISCISYIIAGVLYKFVGLTASAIITLPVGAVILLACLKFQKNKTQKKFDLSAAESEANM
ncbi:MAG: Na+/H+ antiporter NhaC family protein [Anaerovoracaceae bacterium]|jgi:Na+/H+ antiporter NhaC